MLLDLRHLARSLRRAPAGVAAAVLTLALALGVGAAIFAVVDAVLLTPPPFARPEALVTVGETPRDEPPGDPASTPRAVGGATFAAWRARAGRLAALEAYDGTNVTLTGLGAPERVRATDVTPGFFALLGVAPALGRGLATDDVGRPVAVVSHAFWRGPLAADPRAVGREVVLSGRPHTIIGVLPEHFDFALSASDVWRPIPASPAQPVRALARLARGVSAPQLGAALDEVSRTASPPARAAVTGVAAPIAGDAPRTLGLLAGAGAAAVLLAFVNLAGLLLVRSVDRRRELALRRALGADEGEIARQVLLEAGALVAAGVAGGVLLATWLTPAVGRLAVAQLGDVAARDITVSWRVLAVIAAVAAAGAAACAVVPALAAARRSISDVLRRTLAASRGERRVRRAFVTGEVALAFVLLASVLLLGRSLARVRRVDPGFDARGVITAQLALPQARYPDSTRVAAFYAALARALEQRLGPGAVGVVDELPLTGDRGRGAVRAGVSGAERDAVVRAADPGYFGVLRIPLVAGRVFDPRDDASAPPRVVVSAALARGLFGADLGARPGGPSVAVGRRVRLAAPGQPQGYEAEVVGVVGDVKHRALDEATVPTVYLAARQAPSPRSIVVVRGARPAAVAAVTAVVRDEVARLDRELPVYGVRPMAAVVAASPGVAPRRVLAAAFLGFAGLAVVLGAVGLFGVVAHDVAARRPELALRMALGATPPRLFAATLGQGARLVGVGLAAGGVLSVWATRALGGVIMFGTGPLDLVGAGAGAAAVLAVAAVAAVLPTARRAARTDPLVSLRSE